MSSLCTRFMEINPQMAFKDLKFAKRRSMILHRLKLRFLIKCFASMVFSKLKGGWDAVDLWP